MINFLKYRLIYFFISACVIGIGIFSILKWGFIYSIDFAGGTNLEYKFSREISSDQIKKILAQSETDIVQIVQKKDTVLMRLKAIDEKKEETLKKNLEKDLEIKVTVLKSETVGPVLGKETIRKTIIASALGVVAILIYMTFAFHGFNFALSAVLALFHDVFVVIGSYSLMSHFLGAQVDLLFVSALLTTMSFSVHDTIIIFDKIREYKKTEGSERIEHSINKALTETFVRSFNNSMTIIFMLLALTLLGGSTIKFFTATLLVGTITGTYSSPFVAAPILWWLEKRKYGNS